MKAAYIEKFGGPEVLQYGDLPDPVAGPGEVAQILHHDDAIYPLPRPHDEVVLNTQVRVNFDASRVEQTIRELVPQLGAKRIRRYAGKLGELCRRG